MFNKKKSKDLERQEIKQAIEQSGARENPARRPPQPQKTSASAPLFIKVDKYKELITSIQKLKTFAKGMKHTFSVLNDIEDLRNQALQTLNVTLQRLEKNIVGVDNQLVRPNVDLGEIEKGEKEVRKIENSLSDLENQLSTLRNELEGLR